MLLVNTVLTKDEGMMKKAFVWASAALMVVSVAAPANAKPTAKPTKPAKATTTTTQWLLPKYEGEEISVNAGATVPLKFRLAAGGNAIKSTSGVTVTLTGVACPKEGPAGVGTIAPVLPGGAKKPTSKVFRYSGNAFTYQWKLPKTATPGCYKFAVAGPGASIPDGAIIRIR